MDVQETVPTASDKMLNSSKGLKNGVGHGGKGKNSNSAGLPRRHRSKSEGHTVGAPIPGIDDSTSAGGVVKSAKDKAHDRKPRNMKGRGLPKKGGAGGKGTWGKAGVIYDAEVSSLDEKDPNYDSDKEGSFIINQIAPELTSEQFEQQVEPLIKEYYDTGDTSEVAQTLVELNISHLKHKIAYLAVSMAMEKKAPHREMTSVLISDLLGDKVLKEEEIELEARSPSERFQALLNGVKDLSLDTPDAPEMLGQFIARAVADDCLPPSFIKEHKEHPSELANKALHKAETLLHMNHGIVRLDNVWGVGGGLRPVKVLINKIVLLLKEYLCSADVKEADRCIQELDVPHFHHEIVYEAIMLVLEQGTELVMDRIQVLLKHLSDVTIVTRDQLIATKRTMDQTMREEISHLETMHLHPYGIVNGCLLSKGTDQGFERVYDSMDDIILDIPHAYRVLGHFVDKCARAGVITLALRDKAPTRGRKRFVSEGDGGNAKF